MVFVYPVGIPVVYLAALFRYKMKINPKTNIVFEAKDEKVRLKDSVIAKRKTRYRNKEIKEKYPYILLISFLYDNYIPQRW